MISTDKTVSDLWSSLYEKMEKDQELKQIIDELELLDETLKEAGEENREPAFKLPYAGAEPLVDSPWK